MCVFAGKSVCSYELIYASVHVDLNFMKGTLISAGLGLSQT